MRSGTKFIDKDPLSVFLRPSTSFTEFQNTIIQKLGLQGQPKFTSSVPLSLLLAKLVDVVSSSRGSNRNPQPSATAACSSSRHVSASLSLSVIQPEAALVASPSFAADLNRTRDRKVDNIGLFDDVAIAIAGIPEMVPEFRQGGAPDGVEDVFQDEDDDDVDSTTIADDSDDELARSTPTEGSGAIISGTPQYLPHFSTLELDAVRQQGFQDKEEVVQSVKTYSIRRGVEYKVLESDYHKYHGKCKEFGNGCTRLIRISLRQCRGISEVKRADATVSIKLLQNATEAYFGFRPTYRSVWMAKQKVMT
ncbi:uncharacterized protein LOC130957560 [Arachis stenosperma]|uniref:uncharacterized protein LOC130957560 n=1 Tax=Arachis stenosperma TaxID=217475 RepID=UPI0025ACD836|nr:uncharacterized protein LOC130957560 [Arachis stenosperma]